MVYEGRCWKLGDEIPIDGALLELKYVHLRITDPEELAKYVLKSIRPEFSENCSPGDLLVAGNRFGHGNAHVQAFRGFSSLKIGIIAEWMPRGAYRACVIAGIPFLPKCPGVSELCREGERLKVNFSTGLVENLIKELDCIRINEYASSFAENSLDGAGVSAAIKDCDGEVLGAVTILGPINRINKNSVNRYKKLIIPIAEKISNKMGFHR